MVSIYQLCNFLWHKLWKGVSKSYITRADIALSAKVTRADIALSAKVRIILGDNNKTHCFTGNFFYPTMRASALQNLFLLISDLCTIDSCL